MAIDREKILQTAQRHVDRKKYDRAIVEYQRLIQADPTDARTRLKIGDLQARSNAYADAVATYDEVGRYYAANGFALKAIAVYKQIRELIERHVPQLGTRYGHILPKLAEIYSELGLISDALAAYDEVATRLQKAGRDMDAVGVFRKMVSLDESNPLPQLRYAEACIRIEDIDTALESFSNAARLLTDMGRREDALRVYERVLHFRVEAKYALPTAELYLQRGAPQDGMQALSKLQVCFQANPHDLTTLDLLSRAFTIIGQTPKAIEVKKEMARIAYDQGKYEQHLAILAQLQQLVPNDEQVAALAALPPRRVSAPPSAAPDIEVLDVEDAEELPADELDELEEVDFSDVEEVEIFVDGPSRPTAAPRPTPPPRSAVSHTATKAEAETYRSLQQYDRALATIRRALADDPSSTDLRESLRDLLAESGNRSGALAEMLTLARLYWEQGNLNQARTEVEEILEVDPGNPDAVRLLASLAPGTPPRPDGGLATHDIEDGVSGALSLIPEPEDLLPELDLEPAGIPDEEIAAALEEAEFFALRHLFDDARQCLAEQLKRTPGHPRVLEKLAWLDERTSTGARKEEATAALDDAFDIAASLESLNPVSSTLSSSAGGLQLDVDAVFAQFKAGVRAQVSDADSSTHYDLAVAYKEMGLLPDAILEFEIAARAANLECTCFAMIATIRVEQGQPTEAVAMFKRALAVKSITHAQRLSVLYDLASAYELLHDASEALKQLQQVQRLESRYRDVAERIEKLRTAMGNQSDVRDVDSHLEELDEVDQAFERLLETK